MKKVREEGDELKKTLIGTAPVFPTAPGDDDFTSETIISSTDMQYAGNPWAGAITITEGDAKSFGVLGQGTSANQGFDFDLDSYLSRYDEMSTILGVTSRKDAVSDALDYFP